MSAGCGCEHGTRTYAPSPVVKNPKQPLYDGGELGFAPAFALAPAAGPGAPFVAAGAALVSALPGLTRLFSHPYGTCGPGSKTSADFLKCWSHPIPNGFIPYGIGSAGWKDNFAVCPGAISGRAPSSGCGSAIVFSDTRAGGGGIDQNVGEPCRCSGQCVCAPVGALSWDNGGWTFATAPVSYPMSYPGPLPPDPSLYIPPSFPPSQVLAPGTTPAVLPPGPAPRIPSTPTIAAVSQFGDFLTQSSIISGIPNIAVFGAAILAMSILGNPGKRGRA